MSNDAQMPDRLYGWIAEGDGFKCGVKPAHLFQSVEYIRADLATPPQPPTNQARREALEALERDAAVDVAALRAEVLEHYKTRLDSHSRDDEKAIFDALNRWHKRGLLADGRREQLPWRCFHCDETFSDHELAKAHFGQDETQATACRLAERNGGLIALLRDQESELRQYRNESDATSREFYTLGAEHYVKVREAEEVGYARGLSDGRAPAQADKLPDGVTVEMLMRALVDIASPTGSFLALKRHWGVIEACRLALAKQAVVPRLPT